MWKAANFFNLRRTNHQRQLQPVSSCEVGRSPNRYSPKYRLKVFGLAQVVSRFWSMLWALIEFKFQKLSGFGVFMQFYWLRSKIFAAAFEVDYLDNHGKSGSLYLSLKNQNNLNFFFSRKSEKMAFINTFKPVEKKFEYESRSKQIADLIKYCRENFESINKISTKNERRQKVIHLTEGEKFAVPSIKPKKVILFKIIFFTPISILFAINK